MSNMETNQPDSVGPASADHGVLLRRILELVEKGRNRGRLELVIAIVLSLSTFASTWSGYQSGRWSGSQSSSQSAADTSERKAAESILLAMQRRTQDGLVLLEFWRALRERDSSTADTIRAHMHPVLSSALQASIDGGILTNPAAAGPMQRPEYILAEEVEAAAMRDEAKRLKAVAATAGQAAGDYVLLTLMFASVLFFAGIGGTFADRRIRMVLAGVAVLLFGVAASMLLGLPVAGGQ